MATTGRLPDNSDHMLALNDVSGDEQTISQPGLQHAVPGIAEATGLPPSGDNVRSDTEDVRPSSPISETAGSERNAWHSWQEAMKRGRCYAEKSNLEFAMREFESAKHEIEELSGATPQKVETLRELAKTKRRFGRYDDAVKTLQQARITADETVKQIEHVQIMGELGVALRGIPGCQVDAFEAFQKQYDMAKELDDENEMCRAVGNLGTSNYELNMQDDSGEKMNVAVEQLKERVRLGKKVKNRLWESIGYSRLSACYLVQNKKKEAIDAALEGLNIAKGLKDPIVLALSRFFYGRVLLQMYGRDKEALLQFNPPPEEKSSPVIALCKEPSSLHARYLSELIRAGADLERTDEDGYTALDWAIFNNQEAMENLVLQGLQVQMLRKVEEMRAEAERRKAYREILQEKLRPKLMDKTATLQDIREAYEDARSRKWAKVFDELKFVWYPTFEEAGEIPRSNPRVTSVFQAGSVPERYQIDALIFFSYRWVGEGMPDDSNHTQYNRMVRAANEYLRTRGLAKDKLGIWVDYACINQDDPIPGIATLPMTLAQCDAVISLVDERYYHRAWCTVESYLMQTLQRSYGRNRRFEFRDVVAGQNSEGLDTTGTLLLGGTPVDGEMENKEISNPLDRPRLLFLKRQSTLLGKSLSDDGRPVAGKIYW